MAEGETPLAHNDETTNLHAAKGYPYSTLSWLCDLCHFIFAAATVMDLRLPFAPAPALLIGRGAIILSFVGAIHWGAQLTNSTPRSTRFIWSIPPPYLAG